LASTAKAMDDENETAVRLLASNAASDADAIQIVGDREPIS
jgi:hypothetical protein